jgi:hypothetical protein
MTGPSLDPLPNALPNALFALFALFALPNALFALFALPNALFALFALFALLNGCEPNKLPIYITAEMTNRIRMMQQMVYPPAVTASDVKFRMVMVSTMTEMTNNMMNSYMYDRVRYTVFSFCPSSLVA